MSQLRSRNGSRLRAFAASDLRVFGSGFKTYEELYHDDVEMSWDIDLYHWNLTADTTTLIGKAGVIFGPYFFTTHAYGLAGGFGDSELSNWFAQPFDGTPAPATDTMSSNSLTLSPNGTNATSFQWNSWPARGSLAQEPFWEDTGSSMIFRGETRMHAGGGANYTTSPEGIVLYAPAMQLTGGNRLTSLEWIMLYLTGFAGHDIGTPTAMDAKQIVARVQVTVTA